jgi:sulfite reductase (NADPH) flavoprotein alpha-component
MNQVDKSHPYLSKVIQRQLLTPPPSSKETYHVSLDLGASGVTYKVGDSIAVFAQNNPILVEHILAALKAHGDEPIVEGRSQQTLSLRDFLTCKANLARLTSSFLKLMYNCETHHDKKNQLYHLLQPESKPLLMEYLQKHDPLDLLKQHQEASLPLQEFCDQFGPLLPRFYSVASSLLAKPGCVDLLVARFTFDHLGEQRFGVASHFLCHLAQMGEPSVPIYVQAANGFTLPSDPEVPLIMVGPGTGVAPFRAFMQERLQTGARGKNWLIFGERNRSTDFFYEEFWKELEKQSFLKLSLAFSRDQAEKVYVQHRLYEERATLWRWLEEGAIFYVCGDAKHMAKDVEATLLRVVKEEGQLSEEAAKAYIKGLRAQKRYLQDIY